MRMTKEEMNARARAAYRVRVSTPEGRAAHREKKRLWDARQRPGGIRKNKPPNYWTFERCAEAASQFNTR